MLERGLPTGILDRRVFSEDHLLRSIRVFLDNIPSEQDEKNAERLLLALLRVQRRRFNLHRGWNRAESIVLEIKVLEDVVHWTAKQDPIVQGLLKIIEDSGTKRIVTETAKKLIEIRKNEISAVQQRIASNPRPTLLGGILDDLVAANPSISAQEVVKEIRRMVGQGIVTSVTSESIELDDVKTGRNETVAIEKIRSRLGHAKERYKKRSR